MAGWSGRVAACAPGYMASNVLATGSQREATVDVEISGPDLSLSRRFAGSIDADSSTAVGTVAFRVPEQWGAVEVRATVHAEGMVASHHQTVAIQLPLS